MSHDTWRKMGHKRQFEYQQRCSHANVRIVEGTLPHCDDCTSNGPWSGHPTHGHFPNGDPA